MNLFEISNDDGKRAVAYYRHSAEDKQENSVPIQRQHAHVFAKKHGIRIIHEEADEGKSGLLADRPGFNSLFKNWICSSTAPEFEYVLVYDVSRWGRFQDQDEAAYYEWRCKMQGKQVVYVSRGFPKEDQKLISHLQTSIERYMAAEYSRQLSEKVWHGCMEVSRQGFSVGGAPCYGMKRLLLNEQRKPVRVLKIGEHKQIANERVTFIPADDETARAVKEIFRLFVEKDVEVVAIAKCLNERKVKAPAGGLWTGSKVLRILRNEAYIGRRIYNKTWRRLKQGWKRNPRRDWVVKDGAYPALINKDVFRVAQQKLKKNIVKDVLDSQYALRKAREIFTEHVRKLLLQRDYRYSDVLDVVMSLPVTFALKKRMSDGGGCWCFVAGESLRISNTVLAVGVDVDSPRCPIDRLFVLPEYVFGISGVCVIMENDDLYRRSIALVNTVEEEVIRLAELCRRREGFVGIEE